MHADLWRQVAHLCRDHGHGLTFHKTKAHRSRREAEQSADDPAWYWAGNCKADHQARNLCKATAREEGRGSQERAFMEESLQWLVHIGIAAEWCFRHWPVAQRQRRTHAGHPCRGTWKVQPVGGHDLERWGRGWRCRVCHACARGNRGVGLLQRNGCRGTIAHRISPTHQAVESGGVIWCSRCGAHARKVVRTLRVQCLGAPRIQVLRNCLEPDGAAEVDTSWCQKSAPEDS